MRLTPFNNPPKTLRRTGFGLLASTMLCGTGAAFAQDAPAANQTQSHEP